MSNWSLNPSAFARGETKDGVCGKISSIKHVSGIRKMLSLDRKCQAASRSSDANLPGTETLGLQHISEKGAKKVNTVSIGLDIVGYS